MTEMLSESIVKQVREFFKDLKHPVAVLLFTSAETCDYCEQTRQLLEEVCALSKQFQLSVYDLEQDAGIAGQYHVADAPAIVIAGLDGDGNIQDYGIRYLGIPAGHEFTTLIQDLVLVSKRDSGLSAATRKFLAELKEPVRLEVFVTPT